MKYLFILISLLSSSGLLAEDITEKDFKRVHLSLAAGSASISIPVGTYSDPGFSLSMGYFFHSKISINGSYFLTSSPTGASNLNGLGAQARYYLYNTETTFILKHREGKITTYDRFYSYAGLGFIDREIRTSRTNESYTGFSASLAVGMKFDERSSVSLEFLQGKLKSPSGTTTSTDATFTNLSAAYNYLF